MSKSTWNNRVLAHQYRDEVYFCIHEVYYTDGVPHSYTEDPVTVSGDSLEEIKWALTKMQECLEKPVLWYGVKFPQEFKKEE